MVYLIGIGPGNPQYIIPKAVAVLSSCQLVLGAARMLQTVTPLAPNAKLQEGISPTKIVQHIAAAGCQSAAVVFSGDLGFYSGAAGVRAALDAAQIPHQSLSGISSLAYFCAALNTSWQDVLVLSAHGRVCNVAVQVAHSPKTFILTDATYTPQALCATLCQYGMGGLTVHVGEALSYPEERITTTTAAQVATASFAPLSVLLIENPQAKTAQPHGLEDDAFLRGSAPMTKMEVRAVSLSKLGIQPNDVVWDIGAGTGSVSIEAALLAKSGTVYAIEQQEEALSLLKQNKIAFALDNLKIIQGTAPDILSDIPQMPQRVFIGGSGGNLPSIIAAILQRNPNAKIVLNAITLETLTQALTCAKQQGLQHTDIVQISAARAKGVGPYHMLQGQNPVYVLSWKGSENP